MASQPQAPLKIIVFYNHLRIKTRFFAARRPSLAGAEEHFLNLIFLSKTHQLTIIMLKILSKDFNLKIGFFIYL